MERLVGLDPIEEDRAQGPDLDHIESDAATSCSQAEQQHVSGETNSHHSAPVSCTLPEDQHVSGEAIPHHSAAVSRAPAEQRD
eukprot:6116622-Pyramimonas_sp.AAC.1